MSAGVRVGNFYERRRDRAHRRYLQAVKALAVLRKMALPRRGTVVVKASTAGVIGGGVSSRVYASLKGRASVTPALQGSPIPLPVAEPLR